MANLLYVATLSNSLSIFTCEQLPDGAYYLVQSPGITCYEGDHAKLMVLACITLVVYSLGWPTFLFVAFRVAQRKFLLKDPKFVGMLGFLYTRFEMDWCVECSQSTD